MELVMRSWEALADSVTASDVLLLMLRLTLIGATGHLVLALLHRSAAATRHLVAVATLAVMVATPLFGALGGPAPTLRMRLPFPDDTSTRISPQPDAPRVHEPTAAARDAGRLPDLAAADESADPTTERAEAPTPGVGTTPSPVRVPWHRWPAAVVLVALIGALAFADLRLISLASVAWIARRARKVEDPRVLARMTDAAARLGFRRAIELRVTRHLFIPAVTVFPQPVLLLPEGALGWSDTRLHAVLLHELAHVARRDEIGLAISRLTTAALWFHPLAWSLARAARQECERACDAVVIASGVRPSDYAAQLLAIARGARDTGLSSMSLAFARPSSFEGRLVAILRADAGRPPLPRRAEVLLTLALVAVLAPIAAIRVVAAPAKETRSVGNEVATPSDEPSAHAWDAKLESEKPANDEAATAPGTRWLDLGPAEAKSGEEWASFGCEAYQAERYQAAGDAFERAARAGFDAGHSWYRSAASFALAGRNNQAVGALRAALDHDVEIGRQAAADDDFDGIRSDRRFQMLTTVAPGAQLAGLSGSSWKDDSGDEDDPQQLKTAATNELRNGDPERAAALFLRQYSLDSTASALYNAACSYAVAGREDRALAVLERSLHAGYGDPDKLRSDSDLDAIRDQSRFEELVRIAGDLELEFPKGKQRTTGEERAAWSRTLPRHERITREMPGSGRAWFNLGFADLRAGKPADAREAFLRALGTGYRRGTTHYNIACAEAQLGNDDSALRHLTWAEQAGMDVDQVAPGDNDLEALRDNPEFRDRVARWEATRERDKESKHKQKASKGTD
jgi:beta-lactamase regulating signal transducer with metallopeptidase domain/tetratricopeptide (TPR) repeat protein